MQYTPPTFQGTAFNCPSCDAYAHMQWARLFYYLVGGASRNTNVFMAFCSHCGSPSYWLSKIPQEEEAAPDTVSGWMVYPDIGNAPLPHPDMPNEVLTEYEEARSVVTRSPRSASALLRLAIQKLCINLGEKGENLNKDIAELVKKGLPGEIQQALDVVRVVGNNAVHPGELSPNDVAGVAASLFELVNHVVEDRITKPKILRRLFDKLPEGAKEAIKKRDGQ